MARSLIEHPTCADNSPQVEHLSAPRYDRMPVARSQRSAGSANGCDNGDIAASFVSASTVKHHVSSALEKLGVDKWMQEWSWPRASASSTSCALRG